MASKEDVILGLFFNWSSKHWHFEEILKKAKVSRSKASKWLRAFRKEGLILRIKEKGKMPYFIAHFDAPAYRTRKRIFGLQMLHRFGLMNHLMSLQAKTVIIFGSFSRSDWHGKSDVDIFIQGKEDDFDPAPYEKALKRQIHAFFPDSGSDFRKFSVFFLQNVIKGYRLKGELDDIVKHGYAEILLPKGAAPES